MVIGRSTNRSTTASPTFSPIDGSPFGARVEGIEPSSIDRAATDVIRAAHRAGHGLLVFPFDRLLDADELHALTAAFGQPEFAPGRINGIGKRALPGEEHLTVDEQVAALWAQGKDPYITYLGNVDAATQQRKDVDAKFFGEWEWHTDMSYIEVPPTFSILHARQIPDEGGDTDYCSQVMAARELPADLRRRIDGLQLKHDSTYGSSGLLRPGMTAPASPVEAIGHVHPMLRVVPATGDEALYLGRRTNAYVPGLPLDESERLLDELWAHATQDRFSYRHRWTVGDVVVWDNRMLLHRRQPFDPGQVRNMWRTQTKGEAVVAP